MSTSQLQPPGVSTTKTASVVPISDISDKVAALIQRYGCGTVQFSGENDALYERHLVFDNVLAPKAADVRMQFEAFARAVRDVLSQRWIRTEQMYEQRNPKRIYYVSMEFLLGRSLSNNVMNLMLDPMVKQFIRQKSINWPQLVEQEPDAGLGNGGLGRLAACFLDSMATLHLPAMGYGLRYEYGIFRQSVQRGWQQENPDNWLRRADPWEAARPHEAVEVKVNCSFEIHGGTLRVIAGEPFSIIAIPFDRPVVGYGANNINTLRLWAAAAPEYFNFEQFSSGDFIAALADSLSTETITRVLYPDDSTSAGRALRFLQEYFLVAASLADIVRRFQRSNGDWDAFPAKVALQMNDTHPALAVPELMRILLDEAHLGWDAGWDVTQKTLAYTNHTLLPEALEKWPVAWFEMLLPRHLEIVLEINQRLLDSVRKRFPGDDGRLSRVSLVEEGPYQQVRMSNLSIVGSHSTNGVASLHSRLLRTTTVRDLADLFPERFNNKTNGVTPRRWLLQANPALARTITQAIGDAWITDLNQLQRLKPLIEDASFCEAFRNAKQEAKRNFADWLKATSGMAISPETMIDSQVKRIHEYKRQFLNALRIVVLYNRLRNDPEMKMVPRTFLFAGKAAPAYHLAKVIIKFINNLAETLDNDPSVRGRLKVLFLPDYSVSLAEHLIPASDVSNQISTAGYEASGTSNMKFMMNGALTVGTRDGATIEMAEEAGEENLFLFGLSAEEVTNSRGWYSPRWHYENEPETRAALDLIFSDHFSPYEHEVFEPLRRMLFDVDHYMHLADLKSYLEANQRVEDLYLDPDAWTRKAILNVACSGKFSSDRTIGEYASEIWGVSPCPTD
ncbi:MAG TPA: glycogen/starch/alpha-glucan phosphorylase [Candidatus Sulfotelmatobacter sp.]|nr:glycogen/starch/alpha-glucan phosphorylase [Candidatus Sulfotelmatobacter sp.]